MLSNIGGSSLCRLSTLVTWSGHVITAATWNIITGRAHIQAGVIMFTGGERREIENNELENSLMSRMFQTFLLPFALFLRRRRRIMSWKRRCTQTKEIKLIFAGAGLGFRSRHCRGNLRKQRAREKRKTLAPRSAYEFCLTKKYFRYKKSDSKFH